MQVEDKVWTEYRDKLFEVYDELNYYNPLQYPAKRPSINQLWSILKFQAWLEYWESQ